MLKRSKLQELVVYCDGGSRGNPGPAASAFVIFDSGKKEIVRGKKYLGKRTNNYAEYCALGMALQWIAKNRRSSKVSVFLDSELVCKQVTGKYKVKSKMLLPMIVRVKEFEKEIEGAVSYTHVLRDKNKIADALVNESLNDALSS